MDSIATVVGLLTKADPGVLVAVVCIVALLVVAECVKILGKSNKEDE